MEQQVPTNDELVVRVDTGEILSRAHVENRKFLMEHESKQILENAGIKTTGGMVALSEDEAVEMSGDLGYPVVLKIVSPDVIHKTDFGGVKLDLKNEREVKEAYHDILSRFRDEKVIGVSVQKMAPPGVEAIVGVTRDASFGPVLMFGLGGIFAEVLKDVTFRVLPITEDSADEMLEEIKGYSLLKGYRGQSVDIPALKELLLKVSNLAITQPEITELELNPVVLYPSGYLTVDARMFIDSAPLKPDADAPAARDDLYELFYPQSIAVLGATDSQGKLGYNVMWNLLSHQFHGKLYPINPRKEAVLGLKAYKSILDIEDMVDVAIVIVPAEAAPKAIEDCCTKGVKYIVVETAGFAETGEAGRRIQSDIKNLIAKRGCRLLGPNCSGVINTHHNMVQSIGPIDQLRKGNVGLIAQAGVYAAGILTGLRNVLDFGIIATIGNKMDVSEADILEFMGQDENIKVIALYMEDVTSGQRFVDIAGRVSQKKPVIVLKAGRTEAGKKAVSSHTASMAGSDEINSAAFRQSGVIRARDNEHLFALLRAFSKQPLPKGPGVLVVTYTGSLGVAATDMLYTCNLRLAELEPHLKKQLASVLDDYLNIQNPVDCSFSMNPEQAKKIIEIGVQSEDVHGLIVIVQGEMLDSYVDTLARIDYKDKPVLCCVACKEFMMDHVIRMEQKGIPVYSTPEMAAEVLGEMYRHSLQCYKVRMKTLDRFLADNSFTIGSHSVHLRLLTRHDMDLWTEFVNSCSPRSLWLRFLSPFSATPETAQQFCNINPEEEVAVAAEITEGDRKKLIAIARLIKCRPRDEVEYAVIVTDSWQQKRLGRMLSQACLNLAKHLDIRVVNAETIQENFPIVRVLNHFHFKIESKERNMILMSLRLK
ncbi:GNAT family N-acetyltransferase [Syntrophorhabdus aromaticivorans]|uniref:Acyl-CoA synthetase n=1 Tax=Syntrophorhabdus aromaticivorans TaxID=328301 RepID=A0A971S0S7_9BACT|nr:GNAT family N-acetyltransferase [Syntrophorhabdus aromaticivorans]NLW35690.1 acyl-CoA synthetase [Syntrophorhabdus aromaticivorans]